GKQHLPSRGKPVVGDDEHRRPLAQPRRVHRRQHVAHQAVGQRRRRIPGGRLRPVAVLHAVEVQQVQHQEVRLPLAQRAARPPRRANAGCPPTPPRPPAPPPPAIPPAAAPSCPSPARARPGNSRPATASSACTASRSPPSATPPCAAGRRPSAPPPAPPGRAP